MPVPRHKGETEKDFVSRCMSEIKSEYPDEKQRYAVCKSYSSKSPTKMEKQELFVLPIRKKESRGTYLSRCSNHSKVKSQFGNLKDRSSFCLNCFNEYYKWWSKVDFAEVPEDTALGACIAKNKSRGLTYQESYARCASKVVVQPQGGTNPVVMNQDLLVEPVMFAGPVSVDFDETLSTKRGQDLIMQLTNDGEDVHIITRRSKDESADVYKIAKEMGIPKSKIHFTGGEPKWKIIKALGIAKHIDNNQDEIDSIKENLPDVIAEKFGLEDACWEGYEAIGTKIVDGKEVPNCVPIKE
jgi:hypothetical protein